jgi:glycosyltransferase involved in cell wall biosynthesis
MENTETLPLISIIVPVYNVKNYLEKCLQSICGQTYKNLEIILVNDGSTDKSFNICKKYACINQNLLKK